MAVDDAPEARAGFARFVRFGLVGGVNTLIDFAGYLLLTAAGVHFLVANLLSTSAGMGFSFVANRYFTFGAGTGGAVRQGALFLAFTAFGLWVIQPLVIVGVTAAMGGPRAGLPGVVPKCAAIAVGLIWNYACYSRVVFRR